MHLTVTVDVQVSRMEFSSEEKAGNIKAQAQKPIYMSLNMIVGGL